LIVTGPYKEYSFYSGEVILRYYGNPIHAYFEVVGVGGELERKEGVTTVCHIIDKSPALVPWAAKMVYEKLMRIIPTRMVNGTEMLETMSLEEFEQFAANAKGAHKEKLEEAANVGTIAHNWLEDYIKIKLGLKPAGTLYWPDDEKAKSCVEAALDWMRRHNVRWVHTERKVYSREFGYAGTLDGVAICDSCDDRLCCPKTFKDVRSLIDWKSSNYLYTEYLYQTAAYEQAYEEETGEALEQRWVVRLGKEDGKFEPWHLYEESYKSHWQGFFHALELYRTHNAVDAGMKGMREYIRDERRKQRAADKEIAKENKKIAKAQAKEDKRIAKLARIGGASPAEKA
jgi:hypothetical protein